MTCSRTERHSRRPGDQRDPGWAGGSGNKAGDDGSTRRAGAKRCRSSARAEPPGSDARSGPVGVVLHIRPGPASGRSAESCGNTPTLNTVEILPCAERSPLHMGARPLETDILERTPESCGKPGIHPRWRPFPMCNTTATGPRRPRPAWKEPSVERRGTLRSPGEPRPAWKKEPSGRTPSGSPIPPAR